MEFINPWLEIDLNDYENHMKLDSIYQLQTMNKIMYHQFLDYPISSVMILGVAGGNGLNHFASDKIKTLYGVDINSNYLEICKKRFDYLGDSFVAIQANLLSDDCILPRADLVIANLLVEYIGCDVFVKRISQINPTYVSVVIQVNSDENFVSDSPYLKSFQRLDEVLHSVDKNKLNQCMIDIRYDLILNKKEKLPNSKVFIRLDYKKINIATGM